MKARPKSDFDHRATKLLTEGAHLLGVVISAPQIHALQTYLSHLCTWNQRLNLTSIRDVELMLRRHLLDCLAVVPLLRSTGHIMDVGSGAGLPGIPIKVLLPEKRVTMLEPRRRRANFLRHVIRSLKLSQATVLEERLEALTQPLPDPLDECITRAFSDNDAFLAASARLLVPGGRCILMHGPSGRAFLDKRKPALEALGLVVLPPVELALPFGDEARTVLLFEKTRQP